MIGGFAAKQDALMFEYGWQHPRTPPLKRVLTLKGFWPARTTYAKLRKLTRGLEKDKNDAVWFVRVVDIMMSMEASWGRLYVCVLD